MGIYVTSRRGLRTKTKSEMGGVWFSMWQKKLWPYDELERGDELWWHDSSAVQLRWKTKVLRAEPFQYSDLDEAIDRIDTLFGGMTDRGQEYLNGKPNSGYCLAFKVKAIKQADVPRPDDVRFNRAGWERGDRDGIQQWLRSAQ